MRWMQAATTDSERFATVVLPLSGGSLVREGLASVILELLMETAVPPARLCFSLIDRDAVAHLAETAELVNTLREFGCRFMLDEFGGGQGDYAHVRELAVDYVCLQRAVIDEARRNPKDYAMAKSVNELAHFMGKLTLARQTASDPLDQWAKELGIDLILDQTRMTRLKTDKK
jgi:EAL domain-containing protein (putative c-di-GMP-specific phosphodiesterase class I)